MEKLPLYLQEHPDFGLLDVTLPDGFEDWSYHNDVCPRFVNPSRRLDVFIDYKDPEKREYERRGRFTVYTVDPEDPTTPGLYLLNTDDWNAVYELLTASRAELLAHAFTVRLRDNLTAEEMEEVRVRNRDLYDGTDVCATHDFLDANEVMAVAFKDVVGRDSEDGEDAQLWNTAWDIAKSREFR